MPGKVLTVVLLLAACGCNRRPPPAIYNDHLFAAVQAAITKKDASALAQYANRARACRESGQLSDEQYAGLEASIKKARRGDWGGAQADVDALCRQQPSAQAGK